MHDSDKKVQAYRIIAALGQAERFQGKRRVGLSRLSGRDGELNQLKTYWQHCEQGDFRSIVVAGEAGIGKSRLLWSLRGWIKSREHSVVIFNCSAYHTQAGNIMDAVLTWQLAGIKSQRLSANIEAVSHFRKALEMLAEDDHHELRLELLIQMGPSLMAVESWASEEVKSIYRQSVELSQSQNDMAQLFASLRGLWGNLFLTGDLRSAIKISRQLHRIADNHHTDELKIESLLSQAMQRFWLGEFRQSQDCIERVTSLYDQNLHREHAYIFSVDPGVVSLFYASRNLMYLGYPDDSLRQVEASISLAEKHQHYPSLTWGLGFYATVHFYREEYARSHEIAKRGIALSEEHDFQLWAAWGYVLSGCSKVFIDKNDTGLEQIKYGIDLYKKLGAGLALPFFYSLYAESLLKLERYIRCLEITDSGIEMAHSHSIKSSAPELLLLKSRALYNKSAKYSDQAVEISQRALSIAQKQRARHTMLKIITARSDMGLAQDHDMMRLLKKTCEHFTQGQNLGVLLRAKNILQDGDD